ncbi:MAG: DNRLRE domain-containing protein, partial [Planctomycetaceae bacterium]|nr:DNRLRE domain-containing protein [Planctomycetaceae bacterium]
MPALTTECLEARTFLSAVTVQLTPDRDTTIYNRLTGEYSNGAGQFLLAGGSEGQAEARRGLIHFDLSAAGIPDGATIIDVVVTLNLEQTLGGDASVSLFRLLNGWGEGNSDAPGAELDGAPAQAFDATWAYSFFDTSEWVTPGSDISGSGASTLVGNLGAYEWVGGGLINDVQEWLDNPALNHGWAILGDESAGNIKAFTSRDSGNAALRPTLEITYEESVLPGLITGRKWYDTDADGIRIPQAVLDLKLNFFNGNSQFNVYGGNEYWFRSGANGNWYYLLPDGDLVEWGQSPRQLSGTVVESFDPMVYFTPTKLISTGGVVAEPFVNGFVVELIDQNANVVATATTHDIDLNRDGVITPETERGWYEFSGLGPGTYTVRQSASGEWRPSVSRMSPEAVLAYQLDQANGFYFSRSFYQNSGGLGERWLRADNGWYYLRPSGDLYRWNGLPYSAASPLTGTFIASLGNAYYRNPALLHAAQEPLLTLTSEIPSARTDIGTFRPSEV